MLPVVIGTNPERKPWLDDCLASIRATSRCRRVHVHANGGYEPAALRTACATFGRFLFLHDSVVILDPKFWTIVDAFGPAWLAGHPPMFLGIYDAAMLEPLLPDHAVSKREAVDLESDLPHRLPMPTIWPDVTDATHLRMEQRHGRLNMVLGNQYFEKYKGTWSTAGL